jgi:thymidylate kinase
MSTAGKAIEAVRVGPEGVFCVDFFKALRESNILYCVLRNYDQLPYRIPGHDIDILVAREQLPVCERAVEKCAKEHNARVICLDLTQDDVTMCVVGRTDGEFWAVTVDFQASLAWKGMEFFNSADVLNHAEVRDGIRKASREDCLTIAVLNDAVRTGRIKDRYREGTLQEIEEEGFDVTKRLLRFLDTHNGRTLVNLLRGERASLSRVSLWRLRSHLLTRALRRAPLHTILSMGSTVVDYCHRRLRPPGLTVAVVGVDGSGKSTAIGEVSRQVSHLLHRRVVVKQLRPGLLPRPGVFIGIKSTVGPVANPHGKCARGITGSLFLLTYHTLDYIIGYWLVVRPVIVSTGSVVIFDRYFYDYLVDPLRHRVRLPESIAKFFRIFVPNPDLVFVLCCPSHVVRGRKIELPPEEIDNQQLKLRRLANEDPHAVLVDASMDKEKVSALMVDVILGKLAERKG